MLLEIKAGKKDEVPHSDNIVIKINGRRIENGSNYFYFSCEAGQVAQWCIGMKDENPSLKQKLKFLWYSLRRIFK